MNLRFRQLPWLMTAVAIATATTPLSGPAQAQDRSLWLYQGESTLVDGFFVAEEVIYGSCDQDCLDLDLFLYDADTGELVYEDTAVDAVPILVAPWDGNFLIEVTMPNCIHADGCAVWLSSDYGF